MRTSLMMKLIGIAVALALSANVYAVGLGGINVASALGQALKADIQLVALNKDDKASLVARLASPDIYKGAGLEYPHGNKFKFEIESRANGEPYLKVSSAQPINDPFVSLLVELTWSSGKLLREYTFLLDPPGYVPDQPKQAEVQAVAPTAQAVPMEVKPAEQAAATDVAMVESKPVVQADEKPAEKPAEKAVEKPAMAAPARQIATEPAEKEAVVGNITVQRGDTLSKIAAQNKPADVSLERMLVALYRANADQFDGKNMNRIRTGKILRLPDQNEIKAINRPEAAKEIHAQAADWNAYRQKLASAAATSSQPQAAQQAATGKITSSVTDKAPVAKESAKEVLKLSKGEAPGDKAAAGVGGKQMSAQDKKNAAQEDAIAKAKALKEDQARAALLEKNLKDMQRLAQLKSEELAKMKKDAGGVQTKPLTPESTMSAAPVASAVVAASDIAASSAVKPASPAKPKPAQPKVVIPEPSLLDDPLLLAGGAAALIGLGVLGFVMIRRRKAPAAKPAGDLGSTTAHLAAPIAPSPDTGDFTALADAHAETNAPSDDVDPISEAEMFLSFGRDAQAEEILKEALRNTPNNHQIHLKLLAIYVNRKDVNSFSAIARQLSDSGDEEAWHQAAAMGRRLEPNNPMYGDAGTIADDNGAIAPDVVNAVPDFILDDTATEQEPSIPAIDFDLGVSDEQAIALPEQDFSAAAEKTMVLSSADMAAAQAESMDFDVTSAHPSLGSPGVIDFDITSTDIPAPKVAGQTGAALPDLDDLIFDVTSTPTTETQPKAAKTAEAAPAEDDGMAFTLDFPIDEDVAKKPESGAQVADSGFAGITLNLDDGAEPAGEATESTTAGARDEHWHEVATKLDLAKAYQEMGDATGAREILEEVLAEGDAGQRETAQAMIDQLG